MINRIKFGWNSFRRIRLAIGIMILLQGMFSGVTFFIILGLIFTLLPILNLGCCSTSACGINSTKFNENDNVVDEEIINN